MSLGTITYNVQLQRDGGPLCYSSLNIRLGSVSQNNKPSRHREPAGSTIRRDSVGLLAPPAQRILRCRFKFRQDLLNEPQIFRSLFDLRRQIGNLHGK